MKHTIKRILAICMAGAATAVLLAGCGNGIDRGSSSADQMEQNAESAGVISADSASTQGSHEALTICSFNNLITEDFFEAFHEVYPEVDLDVISYAGINGSGYALHSLQNGDIPDIYITSQSFSKESQEKYLLDLSGYDFVNNYSNTLLDSLDINGGIYLLPSGYQLTGIYYNKTILEENGWKVPGSFNELIALSEQIEAAGYRTMGHGMSLDGFPFNYFFNIGNTMYFSTPEGTEWKEDFPQGKAKAAGNDALKETAEYFNKWVENGLITTEHMDTQQFYEGECVFFLCLGLSEYEHTTEDGKTYQFGTIPWLSEDGSNNMLTRTVSRYMGINRSLAEQGNEQKLENALKLLEYISTAKGQQELMSSSSQYMPSLNESALPEDSPYQEINDLVSEGRTVPLLYVGWEQLIIPCAQDIKQMIEGKTDVEGLLQAFDQTAEDVLNGSSDSVYATVEQTLTMEQTAKLVAVAEGKATGVDCAMISVNEYHGNNLCNKQGLGWYLYEGSINADIINVIRPRAVTISVLEMTGAQIKAMRDAGFDLDGNGNPYEYLLFTKEDIELDDETVYRLAVSTGELTEEIQEKAVTTEISPAQAIEEYLRELRTVNADVIRWE